MEIKIDRVNISNVDYETLVEKCLPIVQQKLSESDGAVAKILSKVASMPPSVAKSVLSALPQSTKDEIAILLINKNSDKIAEAATNFAAQYGIEVNISGIEAVKQ